MEKKKHKVVLRIVCTNKLDFYQAERVYAIQNFGALRQLIIMNISNTNLIAKSLSARLLKIRPICGAYSQINEQRNSRAIVSLISHS
jgi:hypothetical protein